MEKVQKTLSIKTLIISDSKLNKSLLLILRYQKYHISKFVSKIIGKAHIRCVSWKEW